MELLLAQGKQIALEFGLKQWVHRSVSITARCWCITAEDTYREGCQGYDRSAAETGEARIQGCRTALSGAGRRLDSVGPAAACVHRDRLGDRPGSRPLVESAWDERCGPHPGRDCRV